VTADASHATNPLKLTESDAGEPPPSAGDRTGEFVALFTRHGRCIYAYILTLVPQAADADEVYQETSRLLWEKFATFERGSHFGAWACRVAYFKALAWHRRRQRERIVFNDAFLEAVHEQIDQDRDVVEARQRALADCMKQLPERDRSIVQQRYTEGGAVKQIAAELESTPNAIYKTLARVHRALLACINGKLEAEGLL